MDGGWGTEKGFGIFTTGARTDEKVGQQHRLGPPIRQYYSRFEQLNDRSISVVRFEGPREGPPNASR